MVDNKLKIKDREFSLNGETLVLEQVYFWELYFKYEQNGNTFEIVISPFGFVVTPEEEASKIFISDSLLELIDLTREELYVR